jgi:hypothetical protein
MIKVLPAVALLLASVFSTTDTYAASHVCLEAKGSVIGPNDFVIFKLAVRDEGGGIFSLSGYVTTRIDALSATLRSLAMGVAAVLDDQYEISLTVSDIVDYPVTNTVEGLLVGTTHMWLNKITLNGIYEAVNVSYPVSSDKTSSTFSTASSGTIKLVACN